MPVHLHYPIPVPESVADSQGGETERTSYNSYMPGKRGLEHPYSGKAATEPGALRNHTSQSLPGLAAVAHAASAPARKQAFARLHFAIFILTFR